jgi:hypothetical protein
MKLRVPWCGLLALVAAGCTGRAQETLPPPQDLATFFADWRAFQRPKLVNGVPDYTAAAMTVEAPMGMHIEPTPLVAEVPAPVELPPVEGETAIAAEPASNQKIARLENWLSKVTRKEGPRV